MIVSALVALQGPVFSAKGRAIDMGHGIHTGKDCYNPVQSCMAGLAALRSGLEGAWCEKLFLSFLCHDPALLLSLCSRPPIASIFFTNPPIKICICTRCVGG